MLCRHASPVSGACQIHLRPLDQEKKCKTVLKVHANCEIVALSEAFGKLFLSYVLVAKGSALHLCFIHNKGLL